MAFFERVIRPHFDKRFFERVDEVVNGVFASADYRARSEGRVLEAQVAYARGTDRYFAVQQGVMEAAIALGAEEATAFSGNFPMPLSRHKRFLMAVCITDSLTRLRGSRARRLLASLNAVLEPRQRDLFREDEIPPEDMYFGMIVVAKRTGVDQRQPAAIYFGVPSSTLRSWHFYERIDNVVGLYDEPALPKATRKMPVLRKTPRSASARVNKKIKK